MQADDHSYIVIDCRAKQIYIASRYTSDPAAVKIRVNASDAAAFEAKSGLNGIMVRRWIPQGSTPDKLLAGWLKGAAATNCAKALAMANRYEGFAGLIWKDGRYGAKYVAKHITDARPAIEPSKHTDENIALVPTTSWSITGFPDGTDSEQVRGLGMELDRDPLPECMDCSC